jgi:hypothetical protein
MTREEVPPALGRRYVAFMDLSGNKSDSHALAIVHKEDDRIIMDTMMEIEPGQGSVDYVVSQFSGLARAYGCREISADAFGAEWAGAPFEKAGTPLKKSVMPKSNLFLNAAQLIKSGKAELIYSDRLLGQFASLDRRPGPQGIDIVQKVPGSRDDLANAVCGAIVTAHMEEIRMPALPVVGPHQMDKVIGGKKSEGNVRTKCMSSWCRAELTESSGGV